MLCLTFGFTVTRLWYGALPYALPRWVPGTRGAPLAPLEA
jgi:hypothetical protein